MKYVMLICDDPAEFTSLSEVESKAYEDEIWAYIGKWQERGKLLPGGAELEGPSKARTIRRDGDGVRVLDGPYTDIKEVIGGFLLIAADDIDEAVAVASEWPGISRGAAVEVRPLVQRDAS